MRGEQSRQRVGRQLGAPDRHAGHVGRDFRRARRHRRRARSTERLNGTQTTSTTTSKRDEACRNDAEDSPGQRIGQRLVDAAAGKGPQRQRDAEIDRAGRDGGDDRLQPAVDDDGAVERAAERARPAARRTTPTADLQRASRRQSTMQGSW